MPGLADLFFGKIALKNGVLTKEQLRRALRIQQERKRAAEPDGRGPTLGEICRELGFLREDEVNAIIWAQAKSEVLLEDTLLGKIAVANGLVAEEQLERALEEQRQTDYHVRLGELLVARGYMDQEQLAATLRTQKRMQESARLQRPTIEAPAGAAQKVATAPAAPAASSEEKGKKGKPPKKRGRGAR